jgi:transposase
MRLIMKKRRKYSQSFKDEAVALVKKSGKSATEVARELGIPATNLHNWVNGRDLGKAPRVASKADEPSGEEPEAELRRLRSENARLRMERDFLKKATAFFAKENS